MNFPDSLTGSSRKKENSILEVLKKSDPEAYQQLKTIHDQRPSLLSKILKAATYALIGGALGSIIDESEIGGVVGAGIALSQETSKEQQVSQDFSQAMQNVVLQQNYQIERSAQLPSYRNNYNHVSNLHGNMRFGRRNETIPGY